MSTTSTSSAATAAGGTATAAAAAATSSDRVAVASRLPAATTLQAVLDGLQRRGITVFAVIDHAGGARAAGLELPDETLVIFGNPAVGTALMQADARSGLDLPLRLLIRQDGDGSELSFHDPRALAGSYALAGVDGVLAKLHGLLQGLAEEAAGAG